MHPDAKDGAHGGLHNLWIEDIGGIRAADDLVDPEPVGGAEDGAHVAGILDGVEQQGDAAGEAQRLFHFRFFRHGQHLVRGLQK